MNILEDARVDSLLKEAYLGFWVELDHANRRQALRSVEEMSNLPEDVLYSNSTASFLLRLMNLDLTGNISLLLTDNLRLQSGTFKFAARALAKFWDTFLGAKQYLFEYRTFPATVIAGRRVIKAIQKFLSEFQKEKESEGKANDEEQHADQTKEKESSSSSSQNQNNGGCSLENQELEDDPEEENLDSGGWGEMPHEDPDSYPGDEDYPPDLDNQFLESEKETRPTPKQPSGIDFNQLEGEEREIIEELERMLQESDVDEEEIQKRLKEKLEHARNDMQDILDHIKQEEASNPPSDQEEKCHEDGHDIAIHVYNTPEILREINHVSKPEKRYARIVKANQYIIDQLRRQLQQIKIKRSYERGGRRGIICYRDLARVVSSKGAFNRPFLTPQKSQGADLLIIVDESYSMLVDEHLPGGNLREEEDDEVDEDEEEHIDDEEAEVRRKPRSRRREDSRPICVAKRSAIILSEALKDSRIGFGVVGFTAQQYYPAIAEKVYKRFDESADPARLGSIWCSPQYTENRDGTSFSTIVEHHFKNSQGKVPIVVVISDGQPNHSGTGYVGPRAIKHTTETVHALQQRVKMFMLSIDISADSYIKEIYGKGNYIVLEDPAELTQKLIYLIKCIAASLN